MDRHEGSQGMGLLSFWIQSTGLQGILVGKPKWKWPKTRLRNKSRDNPKIQVSVFFRTKNDGLTMRRKDLGIALETEFLEICGTSARNGLEKHDEAGLTWESSSN